MSIPGAVSVLVENTDCRNPISVHVKEVVTDELRSFCIQELDEAACPSHPDEMDELKTDIKLEIEGECENVNTSTPNEEYSNVSKYFAYFCIFLHYNKLSHSYFLNP